MLSFTRHIVHVLSIGALIVLGCGTVDASILHDDFNDGVVDSNLWTVRLPFSDSDVLEEGGEVIFRNRGALESKLDLPSAVEIYGRFRFTGSEHDQWKIVTRSKGVYSNPYGESDDGIYFQANIKEDNGNRLNNIKIVHQEIGNSYVLGTATFAISQGTSYDFRILDDGEQLKLYVSDLVNPLIEVTDSTILGNKLAIYNREGSGGGSTISAGSEMRLDFITVNSPIPEPATIAVWSILGLCGVGYGLRRKMRKTS